MTQIVIIFKERFYSGSKLDKFSYRKIKGQIFMLEYMTQDIKEFAKHFKKHFFLEKFKIEFFCKKI